MSLDPKKIHEREQDLAELAEQVGTLTKLIADYFHGLVEQGLKRSEALQLTGTWITDTAMSRGFGNNSSGEDWKGGES